MTAMGSPIWSLHVPEMNGRNVNKMEKCEQRAMQQQQCRNGMAWEIKGQPAELEFEKPCQSTISTIPCRIHSQGQHNNPETLQRQPEIINNAALKLIARIQVSVYFRMDLTSHLPNRRST